MKTITLSILLWIIAFGAMAQTIPSSGNVLWLKADAGVYNNAGTTLSTNGQTVQQWSDQSGSNNHASQATSSLKPTFVTNVLNGNPVVRFGSSMLVTPNLDLSGIDKVDMYVVYKSTNLSGTWECILEEGPDFNSVKGFTFFDNAQTLTYSGMYVGHSGNNFNAKNYPFKANTFKVVNSSFDRSATVANEINLRINGVDCPLFNQNFANDNSGNYNNVPLYIGNRGNAVNSYPLNGDIAEIILYNRLLTPAEKQAVETYLNNKYNIQCGVTTPQPGSGNCLQMGSYGAFAQDGADIDFGSNDFTIEFWTMKRALSSGGTNSACVNKWNSGGSPGTNEWAVATTTDGNNNIPTFYFETGSTYYQANATTSLTTNKWYHIAAAREGNNIKIYVNGILEGTTAIPAGCSVNNVAQRTFMALGYYPWGGSNNSNLDELRIWKTSLSQTTIRDWMCKKETASHPNHANLVRYYRFDETSGTIFGNQVNSCVTEAYSNGGILATSGAPIGDVSAYDYTANTGTANVNFGTPTDNISATMNAGTSAGVHVYGVNEFPNNQNYPGLAGNNKYGGVFVVNGNATAAYNTTYNYINNTSVNTSNEPTLKLLKRNDNAANLWAQATNQTLNTTAKTITATGQNTEYVLGTALTPVPPTCYGSFPNAGDLLTRIDNSASVSLLDQTVDNFTYEIWANPTQALGTVGGINGDRYLIWPEQVTQYGKSGYGVGIAVGTNGIRIYGHAAGTLSAFLSYSTTISSWTHIALTCDAGHNAVLYVNGLPVASTSGISTVRANDGFMFSDYYGHYFGQAADFRLWNYARSGTEIMNGMNTPPANNATGLLAQFSLNNLFNGSGQLIKNTCTNTPTLNLDKITAGTATTPAFNCTGQNFPPLTQPSCAIKFDGAGSYVNVTNSPTTMPNKGTIEFWMNQPSFSDWQIPLSTFSPTATSATFTDGMYFQTYANGNLYFIYASSYTVYEIELIGTLSPNKNYHVALSWDLTAQKIKGYLDGRLIFVKALTTTFPTSIPKITLGGGFANGRYYNGTLDEVRYWNTERTQSEIVNTASNTLAGNETGLVAYYNFNDNTVGGNGQTVTNGCSATGATLNGTTVSTTVYPRFPCSFNAPTCGISFSGTNFNENVSIPHNSSLNLSTFTIGAWVKSSQTTAFNRIVFKGANSSGQNYSLCVNSGRAHIRYDESPAGAHFAEGTTNVADGQWHYLSGTFDGANLKIYVDGVLEQTTASTAIPATANTNVLIGSEGTASAQCFNGKIDEVSIWNTALSASQIFTIMNNPPAGNESGLIGYYNFSNNNRSGAGRTITNFCTTTGSTLNGTTNGTATTPLFECAPPPFTSPECNMVLDGTNDYAQAADNNALDLTQFTVGAYFKTTSTGTEKVIMFKDVDGSKANYRLYITSGNQVAISFTNTSNNVIAATGTSTVTDGTWHYAVGTYDGANLKIYVDGALQTTTANTTTPLTGTNALNIGVGYSGLNKYSGSLDELSVWNTALSLSQIQGMIGQRIVGNEAGLVAYYNFSGMTKDGANGPTYVSNFCTATGAALNAQLAGTATTPKFTCSEIPVAAPPCSMQMNGLVDAAYPDTYPYGNVNNNFTMEVVARPAYSKGDAGDGLVFSPPGSYLQNGTASRQTYLMLPANYNIPGHASVGISLGTNGIAVYEGSASYMPGRIVLNNYPVNDWVHLTVVSENGLLKLYVNGSLKGTAAPSGYILNPSAYISNPVANAVAFHGFFGFAGNVSEYRVWNTALTADQIRANINANLSGSETNLISLYKLTGNAENNTGGRNLTITGLGSVGSANPLKTAGTSCSPIFACASNNNNNRDWKPGSGGMFVGTTSSYLHYADLGNWGNAPAQGSIMLWFNPVAMQENGTVLNTTQFRGANGGLVNAFKLYSTADGKMNLSIGKDTSVAGYKDVATVLSSTPTNKWYHFALTWNTTTKAYTVYINGLQVASGTSNFLPAKFDAVKAGIGHTFGTSTAWNGYIDEISVWDKILSQTEIKDQLAAKINSAQSNYSNVLHYYRFDNDDCGYFGTSGGGQSNTITDYKGNTHGMKYLYWIQWQYYNNFGFPTSSAPIGSYSSYQYNGSTSATTLNIGNGGATTNADVVTATLTSGTADGIHVYGEDVWPNTVNGVNDTVPGSHRYAGVFVVNPNAAQYTLKYNYASNPSVTTAIEPYLKLFKRDNNAVTIWAQATNVTQDATNHFLEATGQNTEYILAKNANTLPLQMLSFTAQKQENHAILKWRTAQMQNVRGFEIQRSPDGVTFTKIGFVAASSLDQYMFDDLLSGNGKYFYRIKIIDNDDKYMYSDIRLIIVSEKIEVAVFPNPVQGLLSITASKNIRKCRVINATGTEVFKTSLSSNQALINMAALSAGVYVVEISFENETVTQKVIKQ